METFRRKYGKNMVEIRPSGKKYGKNMVEIRPYGKKYGKKYDKIW